MRRTVRYWRWRRNPLKRRCDVVEAWSGLAAGLVMALGAPLTGIAAADAMHASLAEQSGDRHRVAATLDRQAPPVESARSGGSSPGDVRTPVHWTGADGRTHSAKVVVTPGSARGSDLPLWVDHRDRPVEAPLTGTERVVQTDVMGGAAAGGLCVTVLLAHRGTRVVLDVRRSRRWQREWERVEPRWTGHRA